MSNKNPVAVAEDKASEAYAKYMETLRKTPILIGDILDYLLNKNMRSDTIKLYTIESWLKKFARGEKL